MHCSCLCNVYLCTQEEYTPEFTPSDCLIILHVSETDAAQTADSQTMPSSCVQYAPLAAEALKNEAFSTVMIVDAQRLVKEWPREAASRTLGPVLTMSECLGWCMTACAASAPSLSSIRANPEGPGALHKP